MPNMKLIKTLLATTFTLAAASSFAATAEEQAQTQDRVVVSTQEQPGTQAATDATAEAPASTPAPTN